MHTTTVTGMTYKARRASDSPAARMLARAGLTARGVIYVLIGEPLMLLAALGLAVFGIYGLCEARWRRV
jgi:hypothetical protein